MSKAFELAKELLCTEESVRVSTVPFALKSGKVVRNNVYDTIDVSLTTSHDCYSVDIPAFFKSVNHMRIDSCESTYSYRINHGKWVDVDLESEIVESGFDIQTIDIKNDAGTDTLHIYLEGIRIGFNLV